MEKTKSFTVQNTTGTSDSNVDPSIINESVFVSGVSPVLYPQVWWELEGPQVPLRPDCLAIVNNFAFLLGGEELGPDGEFHASSKVYRYDPRQNSWLRMADMSVPRLEEPLAH